MFDETPVARIMTVYEEGGTKRDVLIASQKAPEPPPEPFALKSIRILEPKAIPHRQWLYGNHLIRGFVTLLIAPGGTGKSSVALAMCMSLAINRSILGPHIFQQCNAALLNLEDPQEEIDRRIAALAIRYDITNEDIKGRFFVAPAERGVRIASYGPDGFSIVHPDEDQIVDQLIAQNIGVLGVDPFAESHTLEENSNPQMVQASAAWRRVARKANCAVLLTHHVRKGLVDNIEAARGAKALTDSARVGLLLSTMTDEEAKALAVAETTRLQYVRLDDAKANMAARAPKAAWFHLGHVTLDNSDDVYANGDNVVVVEPWKPTSVWEAITPEEANVALDRIAAGIDGEPCTDSRRGGAERWAGRIIVEMFHYSEEQAAEVIRVWIMNGVLEKETFKKHRRERTALRVNDIKRPGMLHERNAP